MKHFCAPLFKGVIKTDDPAALELVTRRNRVTGTEMDRERYLELVQDAWLTHPFIVQNVVRGSAAALLCHTNEHRKFRREQTQLIAVEGCEHVVGGKSMSGGQIMESIWNNVVPEEVMRTIPKPLIEHYSRSTVEEVRAVLAHMDVRDRLELITHPYHIPRTQRIAKEEKMADQEVHVYPPEQGANSGWPLDPDHTFIYDLSRASEKHAWEVMDYMKREEKKEKRILRPLHAVSRVIEVVTNGAVNIETAMAGYRGKRFSPENSKA